MLWRQILIINRYIIYSMNFSHSKNLHCLCPMKWDALHLCSLMKQKIIWETHENLWSIEVYTYSLSPNARATGSAVLPLMGRKVPRCVFFVGAVGLCALQCATITWIRAHLIMVFSGGIIRSRGSCGKGKLWSKTKLAARYVIETFIKYGPISTHSWPR